jgi:4-hydroxybenzoate polyprenyltransferase
VSVFFGYANFVLSGYFKDIDADRETGYATLPVVFGRRIAAVACDLFAVFMLIAGVAALSLGPQPLSHLPLIPAALVSAGIGWTVIAQVRLHHVRSDKEAHRAIGPVVEGYVLFFAGVSSAMKPGWTPFLLLFCLLFAATLAVRPARNQI